MRYFFLSFVRSFVRSCKIKPHSLFKHHNAVREDDDARARASEQRPNFVSTWTNSTKFLFTCPNAAVRKPTDRRTVTNSKLHAFHGETSQLEHRGGFFLLTVHNPHSDDDGRCGAPERDRSIEILEILTKRF